MAGAEELLTDLSTEFAQAIPRIDAEAEHERWQPGIGPFEEERQLEFLHQELPAELRDKVTLEARYPDSSKWCDLLVEFREDRVPIEAKLVRFRRDNGDIEPTAFNRVFSPFPGQSPSLLTDVKDLYQSEFPGPAGLLGLYYTSSDESFEQLRDHLIAEKVVLDADYWYGIQLQLVEIARFDRLRHPVFDSGAIIMWYLEN